MASNSSTTTASSDGPGSIGWHDLTVPNADTVRDFYAAVVGWRHQAVSMGDYHDYVMLQPDHDIPAGGVCHARGVNADIPPQWLIYVRVESLEDALERCREKDGRVVCEPRSAGGGRMAVIADPAGAVIGLYQEAAPAE